MFSHVMVSADDVDASRRFYDATRGAPGHGPGTMDPKRRCFQRTEVGVFALTKPIDGRPASHGNGSTIGFAAASPEAVDAWRAAR